MFWRDYYFHWQWQLAANPEALWPLVADTDHFDQDTGMNPIAVVAVPGDILPNGRQRLRVRLGGLATEFVQEPFEWISPHRFGVVRHFVWGPLAELRVLVELRPHSQGGTDLSYQVWARPRNLLGVVGIPLLTRFSLARHFDRIFRQYDGLAQKGQTFYNRPEVDLMLASMPLPITLASGGRERLTEIERELHLQTGKAELVERLIRLVAEGDDLTLQKIRPYALADAWNVPRRQVLELALQATRLGLLDFRWELLCPMCRSARAQVRSLAETTKEVHCEACNIDYRADFERSVELTFQPNPSIRLIEAALEFCYAGPAAAPHVLVQQLLQPGEARVVRPQLVPGHYKIHTLALDGEQIWNAAAGGLPELQVAISEAGWSDETVVSLQPTIHLINQTQEEQLVLLERTSWSDHATTAAEVIVLQRFRDLFSQEALRPGEQIFVGTQTIVFTDLRGSTQMYRTIGDAPAFGIVMDHFEVLRAAIVAEGGSIVKTIGDAVMAVFRQPAAALRAMLQAQMLLAQGPNALTLKIGLHTGPCIAVTLNDRLDFFGSTVNLAARLQGLSEGDDIICSQAVYQDPEIKMYLTQQGQGVEITSFQTSIRGFAEDCFMLWRVRSRPKL